MDEKSLEKKLTDKKFLKSNDLVETTSKFVLWAQANKSIVVGLVFVLTMIAIAIPVMRYFHTQKINTFNQKFYQATKGLKKEQSYRELLNEYKDLPAAQVVRLELIDNLLEHNSEDDAIKEIDAGLDSSKRDVFQTILVLKRVGILKQNKKFKEAADFIDQHEKQIIVPFLTRMRMIRADLLLLSGERDKARELYQQLAAFEGAGSTGLTTDFDPALANEAKDQVLLIDLGVI